jgi:hypothetical protein
MYRRGGERLHSGAAGQHHNHRQSPHPRRPDTQLTTLGGGEGLPYDVTACLPIFMEGQGAGEGDSV